MRQSLLLQVCAVAVLGLEDSGAPVISLNLDSKPVPYAKVICGKAGHCPKEEDGFAKKIDLHEVRCCSDSKLGVGWKIQKGCKVWSESEVPKCFHKQNWYNAQTICEKQGARLCSAEELENNCSAGTGCMHDLDLIWSSDSMKSFPITQTLTPQCKATDERRQKHICAKEVCHTAEYWKSIGEQGCVATKGLNDPDQQHKKTFARKCNVFSNAQKCPLPKPSAFDHHESNLDEKIVTTYTLYIKSDPHKEPLLYKQEVDALDYAQRGEYIVSYDVKDSSGNAAETMHFVVVMQDLVPPKLETATLKDIEAHSGGKKYFHLDLGKSAKATDNYDKDVSDQITVAYRRDPKYSREIETRTGFEQLTKGFTIDTSELGVHTFDYSVHDFANIFGTDNKDNKVSKTLSLTVADTLAPTIYCKPVDVVTAGGTFPTSLANIGTSKVANSGECAETCFQQSWDRKPAAAACGFFQFADGVCTLYETSVAKPYYGKGALSNVQGIVPSCDTKSYVTCPNDYTDGGAVCIDLHDSFISDGKFSASALLPETTGVVDNGAPGTYNIQYTCTDAEGNKAATQTRTVVVTDTQPPVLSINGNYSLVYQMEYGSATNSLMMKNFLHHDEEGDSVEVQFDYKHGYTWADGEHPVVADGYTCRDECTNAGSHISHKVTTAVYEGNCNGKWACVGKDGKWTECDGGDDHYEVSTEDALMPGVWAIKYTCKDGSGNEMSRCRTIYNNVGASDDTEYTQIKKPAEVQLRLKWNSEACAAKKSDVSAFVTKSLKAELGQYYSHVQNVEVTPEASNVKVAVSIDGTCQHCIEQVTHRLKNVVVFNLAEQYAGKVGACGIKDIMFRPRPTGAWQAQPIPTDCEVGSWSDYSKCSQACGAGVKQRFREVKNPMRNEGKPCPVLDELKNCWVKKCPAECSSDWYSWGKCSKSCGGGVRIREAVTLSANKACSFAQQQVCNSKPCPVDCVTSTFSTYSKCTKPCSVGMHFRHRRVIREAAHGGAHCGSLKQSKTCNTQACPTDCVAGDWGEWSTCSQKCGGGVQSRTRKIAKEAAAGGAPCPNLKTVRNCNVYACPAFCNTVWHNWAKCPVTCGRGTKYRKVKIYKEAPAGEKFVCPMLQESVCGYAPCKKDCTVSKWGQWGTCTKSCGTGSSKRKRRVLSAAAAGGSCPQLEQTKWCQQQPCPQDCIMSAWSQKSRCSSNCGGGIQTRTRTILQTAKHGAPRCPAQIKVNKCNTRPCPVHCDFKWAGWTACSTTCGQGVQSRIIKVVEEAQHGGDDCPLSQMRECEVKPCPVDCVLSEWGDWSDCSATCGKATMYRTREITAKPQFGGKTCNDVKQTKNCLQAACPTDCAMSKWSQWSECSEKCGGDGFGGIQQRFRTVLKQPTNGGKPCRAKVNTQACNVGSCAIHCSYEWEPWSECSASCGGGVSSAAIKIKHHAHYGGTKCPENRDRICNTKPCPQACVVSKWSQWQGCTRTCAGGNKKRTRSIVREAKYGGKKCPHRQEVRKCNSEKCPIDCVVTNWGSYSQCTEKCGGGVMTRKREVLLPAHYSGMPCPKARETVACNTKPCPVHCQYTEAKSWSACSRSCGSGVTVKKLTIHVQAKYGGDKCPIQKERVCNKQVCPIDCELGAWTEWTACTKSCDRGSQRRTRETLIRPSQGGIKCQPSVHVQACNIDKCPVDCIVGDFSAWSKCSAHCGQGVQKRTRTVVTPTAFGGERCPELTDLQDCTVKPCDIGCRMAQWKPCTVSCGQGTQTRKVQGDVHLDWKCSTEQRVCTLPACPVDCVVTEWSTWSGCSRTCGSNGDKGFHKRTRSVVTASEAGGKACPALEGIKPCTVKACPVHCIMSIPSAWSACTNTCGGGSKTRTRTVVRNARFGGSACPPEDEVMECNKFDCPLDCKVSEWSAFGACSNKCGGGIKKRTRKVVKSASTQGKPCPALENFEKCNSQKCPKCDYKFEAWSQCTNTCGGGMQTRHVLRDIIEIVAHRTNCPVTQERVCNTKPCPVDCVWSNWGGYSTCSRSCGGGSQTRTRSYAVLPRFGGKPCYGWKEETQECQAQACPEDCQVSKWSAWSECSKSCGLKVVGFRQRERTVISEAVLGGSACPALTQSGKCNAFQCPVDCKLGDEYSKWGACSKSCGGGIRKRSRPVLTKGVFGGKKCPNKTQEEACKSFACPLDCVVSKFDTWSDCDASCGGGHQSRSRAVIVSERHGGKPCPAVEQTRFCNHQACPVDCVLSGWSGWSVCSHSCGGGTKKRARSVDVQPMFDGKACGSLSESKICNKMTCAMDCILDESDNFGWTECDRSCGTGYRHRTVKIAQRAQHGGKACPPPRQEKTCNTQPCPSDCVVSGFGAWSACSASCNGGSSHRYRSRLEPATYGGMPCPQLHQVRLCKAHACPHDCKVSKWTRYSACSVTCGGDGVRVRTRKIVRKAKFAGRECPALSEGHACNDGPCAVHCLVSEFTAWSVCTKSCSHGSQSRSRTVTRHAEHGGYACPALHETQPCNSQSCPVDCFVSDWSDFSACSVSCGVGEHTAKRVIKQAASRGGKPCGALSKTFTCKLPDCPVDCQLSNWRVWDECTASCGGGEQWHVRSIERTPAFGGKACGILQEKRPCNNQRCPVDCFVDRFSAWGKCSTSCGGGFQTRQRAVLRRPDFGGKLCGAVEETRRCNTMSCPVDCELSGWSTHTPCTRTCGAGKMTKYRTIIRLPESGGKACGHTKETSGCKGEICPVDCAVGQWGHFSLCDKTCGEGEKTRVRSVKYLNRGAGKECPALSETIKCTENNVCPKNCKMSKWSAWSSCSKTCGGGIRQRVRAVLRHTAENFKCPDNLKDIEQCNKQSCPVNCKMTEWSAWGKCSQECGGGIQARDRVVLKKASFGGLSCGPRYGVQECNAQMCPIDCKVHPWGRWSACSATCGVGKKTRQRSVDIAPAYGGKTCPTLSYTTKCTDLFCPVDCQLSEWMPYSACTQTCGGGIHQRKRLLIIPAQHGGRACPHMSESEECSHHNCPIDCDVTQWGEWGTCGVSCGGGRQYRSRQISQHALYGGKSCAKLEDSRSCSTGPCPIDCQLGPSDEWGACTKTCAARGEKAGKRTRVRSILVSAAYGGRKCPPLFEQEECNGHLCPSDCVVSDWDNWNQCTVTCGSEGYRFRYRQITSLNVGSGAPCPYLTESEKCFLGHCPIDCTFTRWSSWGKCSKSCGSGTKKRTRKIIQEGLHGAQCPVMKQVAQCNTHPCPIDCGMGKWTDYTQCSTTCGVGYKKRTRTPVVYPMYGGRGCGVHTEKHRCNTQECPTDCLVHEYGSWSECSKSCNGGRQLRKRTVWRAAAFGGEPCPALTEERKCNSFLCPINCEVSAVVNGFTTEWTDWTACSRTCGIGMRKRTRDVITEPKRGGVPCPALEQSEPCNIHACPTDCQVTSWGVGGGWSACSLSCGAGDRKRWRSISVQPTAGGQACPHLTETQSCQHVAVPCPVDCEVSHFSRFSECSATCGLHGTKTRVRDVIKERQFGGLPCPSLSETVSCAEWDCPINCKLTAWGKWGSCTKSCGGGKRSRSRSITHKASNYFKCPAVVESEPCNEHLCPIDCVLSDFSKWSECSKTCGSGFRHKTRKVITPPEHGGRACIHLDWNEKCNETPCPVDCEVDAWKSWSSCSHTCGNGQQQRYRHVTVAMEFGGKDCPATFETRRCNSFLCPVDCIASEFGAWTECDATCGYRGVTRRFRTISREMEAGGVACPKIHTEYRKCNRKACPIDCVQTPWNQWTTCTRTCGTGMRRRTRKVIQHARNGGVPCGAAQEAQICNGLPCPIDCQMSGWSAFGACDRKCGFGHKTRTRHVIAAPGQGGVQCPPQHEVATCYLEPCGIDCTVSEWSAWSECSEVCGTGYKVATRTVVTPASWGGQACPVLEKFDTCMQKMFCPHDCEWEWGPWTPCTSTCGSGIQHRDLTVLARPVNGGKACPETTSRVCNSQACPTPSPTFRETPVPTKVPTTSPTFGKGPVLDLVGGEIIYMDATTDGWQDPGATCIDSFYGDISSNVMVGSSSHSSRLGGHDGPGSHDGHVDSWESGVYTLRYSCCNQDRNCAPEMIRVVVVRDRTCPVCHFKPYLGMEGDDITVEASFPYSEPAGGLDCQDNSRTPEQLANSTQTHCSAEPPATCSGDVPDVEVAGTYYITYRVQDANGHWNDDPKCGNVHPLVRTVTVADTLKPVLALRYKKMGYYSASEGAGKETSATTFATNRAHEKYSKSKLGFHPLSTMTGLRLMAEVVATHRFWLLAAAASAISGVALVGFAAQRSSKATRLATIV